MEHKTLDALLDASAPRMSESEATDVLVLQLVDHTVRPRRRSRRSRLTIAAFAVAGTLALGTGAAIAAPFLADWWMWIPDEDLTIATAPFERGGQLITCETTLRITIEGESATDDSAERLQEARDYLRSINLEDFQDEAEELRGRSDEGVWSDVSPEADWNGYLALAIGLEMGSRGLTGDGVGLDIQTQCPEGE